jgi:hypothetical protein
MKQNTVALLLLALIGILIAGLMVETYWDCRLTKKMSMRECLPPIGSVSAP